MTRAATYPDSFPVVSFVSSLNINEGCAWKIREEGDGKEENGRRLTDLVSNMAVEVMEDLGQNGLFKIDHYIWPVRAQLAGIVYPSHRPLRRNAVIVSRDRSIIAYI